MIINKTKKVYKIKKSKGKKKIKNIIIKNKDNLSERKNLSIKENSEKKLNILEENQNKDILKNISEKEPKKNEKMEEKDLTDYELNKLEYDKALELDKRNFFDIYWYLLKREHIILFTFMSRNDFNLFSIKLSRLFFAICSEMALNAFFFSDESIHNIYASGGDNGWANQFPQMIYAAIMSQILQTIINYLIMTDIHYYQLKKLKKENKLDVQNELSIKKCIKVKIIVYFSSTFILFLFFWYTSSAFCAVYPNTQGIFIADSYTSFLMGLLYPFILYLAPTALRYISLKAKEKKNLKILYSLSDKIPFF